jgi:hypothetical protein
VCNPEIFDTLNGLMEQGMDNEELLVNSCIVLGLFSSWVDFGEGRPLTFYSLPF